MAVEPGDRDHQPDDHRRPPGASDQLVHAMGKLSEAQEWVERMRGRIYDFHQMTGHADFLFEDAAQALADAGLDGAAELVRQEVVGRNILDGRWTFQMVEEFEAAYYEPVRDVERRLRGELMDGKRHVYESEMKQRRRTLGHPAHASRPKGIAT